MNFRGQTISEKCGGEENIVKNIYLGYTVTLSVKHIKSNIKINYNDRVWRHIKTEKYNVEESGNMTKKNLGQSFIYVRKVPTIPQFKVILQNKTLPGQEH